MESHEESAELDRSKDSKKKVRYSQKYISAWESDPEFNAWLQPSPIGKFHYYCNACNCNLALTAGRADIKKHASGRKHKEYCRTVLPFLNDKKNIDEPSNRKFKLPPFMTEQVLSSKTVVSIKAQSTSKSKSTKTFRKRHVQKFNGSWASEPEFQSWLKPSSKGETFFYCSACDVHLPLHSGKNILQLHASGKKHKIKCNLLMNQTSVCDIPSASDKTTTDESMNTSEIRLAAVSEHDVPLVTEVSHEGEAAEAGASTGPRKKVKYSQRYHTSWESEQEFRGWVTPSIKGETFAYCGACDIHLCIAAGKMDLKKHSLNKKHKSNFMTLGKEVFHIPSVSVKWNLDDTVKESEIRLAAFLCEYNCAIKSKLNNI